MSDFFVISQIGLNPEQWLVTPVADAEEAFQLARRQHGLVALKMYAISPPAQCECGLGQKPGPGHDPLCPDCVPF